MKDLRSIVCMQFIHPVLLPCFSQLQREEKKKRLVQLPVNLKEVIVISFHLATSALKCRFLFRFTGKEEEINLSGDGSEKPEFGEWTWMTPEQVIELVGKPTLHPCYMLDGRSFESDTLYMHFLNRQWSSRNQSMSRCYSSLNPIYNRIRLHRRRLPLEINHLLEI